MLPAPPCAPLRRTLQLAVLAASLTAPALAQEPGAAPDPNAPGEIQPSVDPSGFLVPVSEVGITGARAERDVLQTPGHITIIDEATIERSGVRSVPELLRREAGVFVTNSTTNPEGYAVEFRGFNNGGGNGSGTLVMVDGRRLNEPGTGNVDWSFVPLDNIESIEVVRGPGSALYGDNAIAGTVHIRTKTAKGSPTGKLRTRAGTFGTYQGSLWAGGGAGPVAANVYLDGYRSDSYRDRAEFRSRRAELQLSFDIGDRVTLGLKGGYDDVERERPGSLFAPQVLEDRRQAQGSEGDNFDDVREWFGQVNFDAALHEHVSLRIHGHHRASDGQGVISDPFSVFESELQSDTSSLNTLFEVDAPILGHANQLVFGVDLRQDDRNDRSVFEVTGPGSIPFPDSKQSRSRLYGVFIQNDFSILENLFLSLGVRNDVMSLEAEDRLFGIEYTNKFRVWSPKAALTWQISKPVSVYASYGQGFRFPNLFEAFGFFGFSPFLEAQTSDTYEAGVKVRTRGLSFDAVVYDMNVHDEILFNPDAPNAASPFFGNGINMNFDRIRHRGVELSASVFPVEWLELYGSYTYDDVEIRRDPVTLFTRNRIPITPRHHGTLGTRIQLPFGFELGANANLVGSRFIANDLANELDKLPSFAVVDLRLGWRRTIYENVELMIDGTIHNVGDELYSEFAGRSLFGPVGFFPAPGRNYGLGFQIAVRK